MGTVSDKLTYLNGTKTALKDSINLMGVNITDDTFRSYADKIKDGLLDIINNGTEEVWNNWEKVSASDVAEATLNNTVQAPMEIGVEGRTLQNGDPTPENPIPIENVEGRSCTNLFNKNGDFNYPTNSYINATTLLEDGTIQTTANAQSNASRGLRLFLKPNTDYVVSGKLVSSTGTGYAGKARVRLMGYETNWGALTEKNLNEFGNFSFSFNSGNNSDWFLSLNALGTSSNNYVAIYDEIQINEGSTALPYEPYFEGKRLDFNVCNKNLINPNNILNYGIVPNVMKAQIYDGRNAYLIPAKANTTYTFSRTSVGTASYSYLATFDEFIVGKSNKYTQAVNIFNKLTQSITTTANTKYIVFFSGTGISEDIQLEEGTTATPYEERKEQMIPFPLQEGQKLMEGDYLADDGVHHVRGQVVLDGTENWILQNASVGQFLTRNPIGGNVILSDKFKVKSSYTSSGKPYLRGNLYAEIGTEFLNEISVEAWKGWLQNNPVLVEYERAQETIEPYTPAQAEAYNKLKNAKSYNETTHIWQVTDGLPAKLDIVALKS